MSLAFTCCEAVNGSSKKSLMHPKPLFEFDRGDVKASMAEASRDELDALVGDDESDELDADELIFELDDVVEP